MKIERIIVEIPELQRLEKLIVATAAVVTEWKRHAAAIETELNTANASLARAQEHRSTHALQASLGEAAAIAAVEIARSEQHSAEQTIGDLQISLQQAQAKLAGAEKNAESARRELAKFLAEKIMKKRIEVAGQLDAAIADFARLFNEFEKLGHEIANAGAVPRNLHGMADHEGAIGLRRVRAALPKFLDKVFPTALHDENLKENLAITEARHWNLQPLESAA
jgi:molecular chaperone GrpE (heat shock protein)